MIRRIGQNLGVGPVRVPAASRQLEADGYAVLRGVFTANQVARLRREVDDVFRTTPAERNRTDATQFRYEMLNRSAAAQTAVGNRRILAAIEPLLGDNCHVIANTAWRNPASFPGGPWHCDAGPHVPRPEGVDWDDRIPYPVFAIGAHILLQAVSDRGRPDHGRTREPPVGTAPAVRSDGRSRAHVRRSSAGDAHRRGRRRRPVRVGRLARRPPRPAERARSLLPAGPLRATRHRAAVAPDRDRAPAERCRRSAGADRPHPHRSSASTRRTSTTADRIHPNRARRAAPLRSRYRRTPGPDRCRRITSGPHDLTTIAHGRSRPTAASASSASASARSRPRSSPASSWPSAATRSPVGSLTQLGTIRLGKRTENRVPRIKDFVPLASLDQIVFGAWDPYPDDAYTAASRRRRARPGPAPRGHRRRAARHPADARGVRPELREAARGHQRDGGDVEAGDARAASAPTSRASRTRTCATGS